VCRYKRQDGRDDWKTIHVIASGETATSMSVHNLESNTAYKFMVLSRNRLGDGLFSATVIATTKGQQRPRSRASWRRVNATAVTSFSWASTSPRLS